MFQQLKNVYHLLKAVAACYYYGFPAQKLKVIGVTGTDGKTTTTHLIYHLLKNAGKKVSIISTVYAKIGKKEYDTGLHTTTPDSLLVQKLLQKASEAGDEYFVLETSSQGLDQNRVWGINFDVGVVSNITHEHLDYHGTYDRYLRSKAILLQNSKISAINKDDGSFEQLKKLITQNNKKFVTYGFTSPVDYDFNFKQKYDKSLQDFNNYNYLAAYTVGSLLGLDKKEMAESLKSFSLPSGRLEVVYDKKFMVINDFAHTPNALDQLLGAIHKEMRQGRLIHVFGSAGLRDREKRPLMGQASARHVDAVIITEEDYRNEDVRAICSEIAVGLEKGGMRNVNTQDFSATKKTYTVIVDREMAIHKALSIAKKDDVVVFTGKGHEKSLCRGSIEYPWSERDVIMKYLKKHDYI